jgi:hypothetical protein
MLQRWRPPVERNRRLTADAPLSFPAKERVKKWSYGLKSQASAKLPAVLAKFPVGFPAALPAPQHRESYVEPLQQLHKAGCESPDPGAVST